MERKVVTILSGGLDSSVLLADLVTAGYDVHALSFDYGQRHARELGHARRVAERYGVEWKLANLRDVGQQLLAGSSQTSPDIAVPHGHYAEETMKQTVVPNRNMIMLSIAVGWAISIKADAVFYGAHGGDHAIYPDCRGEFVDTLKRAVELADWHVVKLIAPYVHADKKAIVQIGARLNFPFAMTWSCYEGGPKHCGKCGTCVERKEAFNLAGVQDPTDYAA